VAGISTVRYCKRECQKRHLKAHNKADGGGGKACACHRCKGRAS